MFSVKGWNITAPVKRQVAPPPTPKQKAADSGKASKKRKRAAEESGQQGNHGTGDSEPPRTQKDDGAMNEHSGKLAGKKRKEKGYSNMAELAEQAPPASAKADADGEDEVGASSKKKRKRNRKKIKDKDGEGEVDGETVSQKTSEAVAKITKALPAEPPPAPTNLTPLQSSMRQKLISSRFRYLNETLYTTKSAESLELFKTNPGFFTEYHEGFARQVESWPENPVDGFAALIVARGNVQSKGYTPGKLKGVSGNAEIAHVRAAADKMAASPAGKLMGAGEPLPRDHKSRETAIIDLGCGTAALAKQLQPFGDSLRLKVHSFDLSSPNDLVTVADIRNLPLPEASVDIAIFSLALMGTNWVEFIEEAWRVLKWKGECWVADVNSRFAGQGQSSGQRRVVEHSVGARVKKGTATIGGAAKPTSIEDDGLAEEEGAQRKDGTDVSAFVAVLQRRGFALVGEPDVSNKMFARMRFIKALAPTKGKCARNKEKKWGPPGKKFIDRPKPEDDISVEDEAKVLKPCVYKTR